MKSRGKDWPSGKIMAEYIDKSGYIDLLALFYDHNKFFSVLFLFVQCKASRCAVEVGCKRFFGLAGYISHPRRTRLGMRAYACLAMLASNIQKNTFIQSGWLRSI